MSTLIPEKTFTSKATQEVGLFAKGLRQSALKVNPETQKVAFDSASSEDFISQITSQQIGVVLPEKLGVLRDELPPEQFTRVLNEMFDSATEYERRHGAECPADVIEVAISKAYSTTREAQKKHGIRESWAFDSATSLSSDPIALQANRAVVSVVSSIMSAVPFATYLPFDIGSGLAKHAIITHAAGLTHGAYAQNANIDGANSGKAYLSSVRMHKATRGTVTGSSVPYTGKITKIQTDSETCDQNAGDLKLSKGRAIVYINGQQAAKETSPGVISGSIVIGALTYTSAGTINNDTGVFTVTITSSSTVLGSTVPVHVESHIDFERDTTIIPSLITLADTYEIEANPWQAFVQGTIGAMSQLSNELGVDPIAQAMIALNIQFENERHYQALKYCRLLSAQNSDTFNFDWTNRKSQLNAAQMFMDMLPSINRLSQKMAIDTMSYGIKYWYVGSRMASIIKGLPSTIFEPANITPRPGIYRLGRLFGVYEVYYSPNEMTETSNTARILFIGGAFEAARSPILFGDAVARTTKPIGMTYDMKDGFGCYEKNFIRINPHQPSSLGCAALDVTDLSV